jgi:hypothetical protein
MHLYNRMDMLSFLADYENTLIVKAYYQIKRDGNALSEKCAVI